MTLQKIPIKNPLFMDEHIQNLPLDQKSLFPAEFLCSRTVYHSIHENLPKTIRETLGTEAYQVHFQYISGISKQHIVRGSCGPLNPGSQALARMNMDREEIWAAVTLGWHCTASITVSLTFLKDTPLGVSPQENASKFKIWHILHRLHETHLVNS